MAARQTVAARQSSTSRAARCPASLSRRRPTFLRRVRPSATGADNLGQQHLGHLFPDPRSCRCTHISFGAVKPERRYFPSRGGTADRCPIQPPLQSCGCHSTGCRGANTSSALSSRVHRACDPTGQSAHVAQTMGRQRIHHRFRRCDPVGGVCSCAHPQDVHGQGAWLRPAPLIRTDQIPLRPDVQGPVRIHHAAFAGSCPE